MARVFTDGGSMALASIAAHGKFFDGGVGAFAFWIFRTATPAAERGLVGMGDFTTDVGWWVNLTTGNLVNADMPFATANKVRTSILTLALNAWTHVVVNSKGSKSSTASTDFTFFFNGVADAGTSTSTGSGAAGPAGSFAFKVGPGPGTAGVANTLAPPAIFGPIAFWNRTLDAAEALGLAGGFHPLRYKEGLVALWDLAGASYEEGYLEKITLIQGATNPANSSISPPIMPMPDTRLDEFRFNVRPNTKTRARYWQPAAGGFTPLNRRTLHQFGSHVGGRIQRVS